MNKRRLSTAVLLAVVLLLLLVPATGVLYLFSMGYDVPFRLAGHYEKNLYLEERPFALSPDGASLVYATLATGDGDLYAMNVDGKNTRRLTSAPDYEGGPCFSPDGRWVLFCRETNKCGHIWRIASDGTAARQLTFGRDYDTNPLYARNGSEIWFQRTPSGTSPGGHYQMFTMTAEGKNVTALDPTDPELGREAAVCSANKSVYYTLNDYSNPDVVSPHEIWQMQADGSGKHPIADGRYPAVSSKGDRVAFVSGRWENELWIMQPDGSQPRQVYSSKGNKHYPVFSPDGRHLFFLEETSHGDFISSIAVDGSDYRRICKPTAWGE